MSNSMNSTAMEPFTAGRRGQLMLHSHDLANWLEIPNTAVVNEIVWWRAFRSPAWAIKNCRNQTRKRVHDFATMTFREDRSYWISQWVASRICRKYRKDLLPGLTAAFISAHDGDMRAQRAFHSGVEVQS
ncbi:MAG TPA: hypothetical protein VFR20_00080 [Burkholderiaceae bacterium]|nr:hypothetical protein [Burkholderiaceae bacterium]